MKIGNFKKLISANLLSISGYLYFSTWIYVCCIVRPDIMAWKGDVGSDPELVGMAHADVFIDIIFSLFILCFIISVILLGLIAIEYLLRKKNVISELKQINNPIYLFLFWIGLALQISPLCLFVVCFFIH